jgi:hypothetical protein
MRKLKIAAIVITLASAFYFFLSFIGRMTGTVVDAETGKPIEGAVVLVEWTMTKGLGLTHTTSYKVTEMVTDNDGRFTVYTVPNPLVNAPDITVYKKGYVAWSSRWIFPNYDKRSDYSWRTGYFF